MPQSKLKTEIKTSFRCAHIPYNPEEPSPDYAAIYLAWIAYPEIHEGNQRRKFVKAALSVLYKANLPGKHAPKTFQGLKWHNVVATLNKGLHRISKHRIPAWIAADEQINGASFSASMQWLAKDIRIYKNIPELSEHDITNAKQRAWKKSRPALAMISALPLDRFIKDKQMKPELLLLDSCWVGAAMKHAKEQAPELARIFRAPIMLVPELKTTQILKSTD